MELIGANWRKSTRSGTQGDCVGVADNLPGVVGVRDSKDLPARYSPSPPIPGAPSSSTPKRR
ncbi:DUF397 domain-containing protein [Micromonospora sp. NPDC048830]|uniref:DUF397 domain-containing protein n=1 Tax=Micromonospora sp. NPDC048830 TaxID=3364257 RepID=UPI0037112D4D